MDTENESVLSYVRNSEEQFFKMVYNYNFIDIKNVSINEFYNIFLDNFAALKLRNISAVRIPVFRARKIESKKEYNSINEIYYPPAEKIKKCGRLNDIGKQILYTADKPITALKETGIEKKDAFLLGVFESEFHSALPIGAKINPYFPDNAPLQFSPGYYMALTNFFLQIIRQEIRNGEEYRYHPSIALAKYFFSDHQYDAIIYPSVKSIESVNIAFEKESGDKNLELKRVIRGTLVEYKDNECCTIHRASFANVKSKETDLIFEPVPKEEYMLFNSKMTNSTLFEKLYVNEQSDEELNSDIQKMMEFNNKFKNKF